MWVVAGASIVFAIYLLIDFLIEGVRDRRFRQNLRLRPQKRGVRNQIKALWMSFLPNILGPSSFRGKVADVLFILLQFLSWTAFVPGFVIGSAYHGLVGFICGLVAGGAIGFWMHRSLGLRGRDATRGFFMRMAERGAGDHPRLLESLIETLRGEKLAMLQCRHIADTHADVSRRLQGCDSPMERAKILNEAGWSFLKIVQRAK